MPERVHSNETHIGEVVELVKTYVRQETLGPLKGIGRWLGAGIGGAIAWGIGLFFVVLGVLRLLQTEAADTFDGAKAILPYVITLAALLVVTAVVVTRMNKKTLQKESRR